MPCSRAHLSTGPVREPLRHTGSVRATVSIAGEPRGQGSYKDFDRG